MAGVVDTLKAAGKLDNTLIIYTSDNGYAFGDHRQFGKNAVHELSIRVPLVVRGPGIPHNETRSQLVNNLDVAATIEQIAGLSPSITPNGRSLTPILDDANGHWRSAILVEGGNGVAKADRRYVVVRTATRKYVAYEADPYELENKAKDPIYAPDAATLRALHDKLKSCAGAGYWVP